MRADGDGFYGIDIRRSKAAGQCYRRGIQRMTLKVCVHNQRFGVVVRHRGDGADNLARRAAVFALNFVVVVGAEDVDVVLVGNRRSVCARGVD